MNDYLKILQKNYNDWNLKGYCEEAQKINDKIGTEYFCVSNPHFFTGDLEADLVLVHLNPKRNKNILTAKYDLEKNPFKTFEDYFQSYRFFGKKHYGIDSPRIHKSPFDKKQIRFIKPLNILPFTNSDIYEDLEIVIDKKLQIELVPFGSNDFDYQKIGLENLEPFIENIINLILSKKRKKVIFCGRVFQQLLAKYIISEKTHEFRLTKKNGDLTRDFYQFIEITVELNGKNFNAIIAPQYAKQGAPIDEYGKKLNKLFGV
jgi:hypothetical protein